MKAIAAIIEKIGADVLNTIRIIPKALTAIVLALCFLLVPVGCQSFTNFF
jgi:hypothetical protein